MTSGMCDSRVHLIYLIYVCMRERISAWASVLLVQMIRQYQSLKLRNSNSVVPLFLFYDVRFNV